MIVCFAFGRLAACRDVPDSTGKVGHRGWSDRAGEDVAASSVMEVTGKRYPTLAGGSIRRFRCLPERPPTDLNAMIGVSLLVGTLFGPLGVHSDKLTPIMQWSRL